jgi:hypothetical protein
MDLTHYEAYIAKHRPQLKPNSVRTYARSLKVMAPEGTQDFEWVQDVDYAFGTTSSSGVYFTFGNSDNTR